MCRRRRRRWPRKRSTRPSMQTRATKKMLRPSTHRHPARQRLRTKRRHPSLKPPNQSLWPRPPRLPPKNQSPFCCGVPAVSSVPDSAGTIIAPAMVGRRPRQAPRPSERPARQRQDGRPPFQGRREGGDRPDAAGKPKFNRDRYKGPPKPQGEGGRPDFRKGKPQDGRKRAVAPSRPSSRGRARSARCRSTRCRPSPSLQRCATSSNPRSRLWRRAASASTNGCSSRGW